MFPLLIGIVFAQVDAQQNINSSYRVTVLKTSHHRKRLQFELWGIGHLYPTLYVKTLAIRSYH